MNDLSPLSRWFLLLPLLAVTAWWPIEPYWQSDDFLALHYAQDFGRVLHDFVGPQYGATDLFLFYRPLITLSFWFDQLVGGADPFVSHLSNVLAHGGSALLVGLCWRRFLPDHAAFCAGLVWALIPGHIGSLAWAVGRVDSHTAVWCLLTIWLFLRQCSRVEYGEPARRWQAVAALALALASKELAFIVPALMLVLAAIAHNGTWLGRARFAIRESAPAWLLFAGYLGFRWLMLGRIGGYLGASYDPTAMALGLATYVSNLTVPVAWVGQERVSDFGVAPGLAIALACVPLVPAVIYWILRPRRFAMAVLLFGIAIAPLAAFLASADNVHNLRYFYFPSVVLAGFLAAPGRIATLLVIAAWYIPFVAVRTEQLAADRESAAMHRAILLEAREGASTPMFIAGLPHQNASGTAVQLHFGVDRMLEPPFGAGGTQLFALRPLAEVPGVFRPWPKGEPFALPSGSTWFFDGATIFGRAPPPPSLPDLPIEGDENGLVDLTSERLLAVATNELSIGLKTYGGRPQAHRLTVFTANGYLCCEFLDHGTADLDHGTIDVRKMMEGPGLLKAFWGPNPKWNFGEGLLVPTVIDVAPQFPVLIEAGNLEGVVFIPTHRARRLLLFRFDHGYAAWARLVQGKD